jgi:hypothetical protein
VASIELRTSSGRTPEQVLLDLGDAFKTNSTDMALAGQLVRSDIRERTARGVDVSGAPFKPYSTKGPYYYNPASRGGKFKKAADKQSAKRLAKKIGGETSRTGLTIKFESYAAFKAAFGRSTVDLQGVAPPHMLDAIVVKVNGADVGSSVSESTSDADSVTVGIYDADAAARASGHQYGNRTLPERKFFGLSSDGKTLILQMLSKRIKLRARKALKG